MAVRRTRADKLKSQLRRSQTTFSWQPQVEIPVQVAKQTKISVEPNQQELVYLKRDLRRTFLALTIVLLLLFLVWRFW